SLCTSRTHNSTYAGDGLNGVLINLSIDDTANPLFAPPGAGTRTAPEVMRKAFAAAVAELQGKRGSDVGAWQVGRGPPCPGGRHVEVRRGPPGDDRLAAAVAGAGPGAVPLRRQRPHDQFRG